MRTFLVFIGVSIFCSAVTCMAQEEVTPSEGAPKLQQQPSSRSTSETAALSTDERLQRLEQKVDVIIRRLGEVSPRTSMADFLKRKFQDVDRGLADIERELRRLQDEVRRLK